MGGGGESFGESPPPLETINKRPKGCTFLHTRPKRTSACLLRDTLVGQSPNHLSPTPFQDLETKKADLFFPSRPLSLKQTPKQGQASSTRARPLPRGTGDAGRRAATERRTEQQADRVVAPRLAPGAPRLHGVSVSHAPKPVATDVRQPSSQPRLSAFSPSPRPEETKGGFSRVTAWPLRGMQTRPQRGRPLHKGTPRPRLARRHACPCAAPGLSLTCRCLCVCP